MKRHIFAAAAWLLIPIAEPSPGSREAALPELPRVRLDSRMTAHTGDVIAVHAGDDLQAAINRAQPGDLIAIDAAATFVGNFVLPRKPAADDGHWITIASASRALLPEGTRVTPGSAALLPNIVSPTPAPAIKTAAGAHHYRLVGLEVGITGTPPYSNGLVALGEDGSDGQTTAASVPHHIVLDRMYVHGIPAFNVRRCVAINSAFTAIVDSYLSECHEKEAFAQAIAGWNGPGPFKIVNNYIEGSGQGIMLGGIDAGIPNLVPSDIEIRGNHITRPASWHGRWLIKNLLELRSAVRVLVEGNVFENSWAQAEDGSAVVLASTNEGGTAPWSGNTDITFRYNVVRNVGSGIVLTASANANPCVHMRGVLIEHNLIEGINTTGFDGAGRGVLAQGDLDAVVIRHNTIMSPTLTALTLGPAGQHAKRLDYVDNISHGGSYGITGDNYAGAAAWKVYSPNGTFSRNVIVSAHGPSDIPDNFYPASISAVYFANPIRGGEGFALSTSPYLGKGTDGKNPGADIGALMKAIEGVIPPSGKLPDAHGTSTPPSM
jgi:hypothetical protein